MIFRRRKSKHRKSIAPDECDNMAIKLKGKGKTLKIIDFY